MSFSPDSGLWVRAALSSSCALTNRRGRVSEKQGLNGRQGPTERSIMLESSEVFLSRM
jgi:hypothetical protein